MESINELKKELIDVSKEYNELKLKEFIDKLKEKHKIGKENNSIFVPKRAKKYQPAWKIKGNDYYYCVGGKTGDIILVKKELIYDDNKEVDIKNLSFGKNAWVINIINGYLSDENLPYKLPNNCNISKYTDVYRFTAVAYCEILEKDNEKLIENFNKNYPDKKNIVLGLHHINGNPSDNRISNLIYLPKFIHDVVHVLI